MTKSRSISIRLAAGALLIGLSLAGCGIRGPLEKPPPKDDKRDEAALTIEEPSDRA